MLPLPDDLMVMGRVSVPFGVRGWVKVQTFTETLDSLLDYPSWWLNHDGQWREVKVLDCEAHAKTLVAHLAGCDDREAALALRHHEIAVPRQSLPQVEENEHYWVDLIGLNVINLQQQSLGVVSTLMQTGANDVLVVDGERQRLIPFIRQVVLEVDQKAKQIRVDWGMDY
ncbi:MAG: ribosome maturation factor RimM [Sulfuricellaceae bacterium]|nr:ribosome maturation factor RimM [Sulfuricellaceae bacterium]